MTTWNSFIGPVSMLVMLVALVGCGKKEPVVMEFYCDETFWEMMWDQTRFFQKMYPEVEVRMIPVLPKESKKETETSTAEKETNEKTTPRRAPTPWRNRPSIRPTLMAENHYVDAKITGLIASFGKDRHSDLYLSDSPDQLKELQAVSLAAYEYPFCYLTLVPVVAKGNPHAVNSVEGIFEKNLRLGIADPSRYGMGRVAADVLPKTATGEIEPRIRDSIQMFDYLDELLLALESGDIDAALVWDCLLPRCEKFADALRREDETNGNSSSTIVPMLVSLRTSSNEIYGRRFADFLLSKKGREIMKKHGFVSKTFD